jgi:hypothetical protein
MVKVLQDVQVILIIRAALFFKPRVVAVELTPQLMENPVHTAAEDHRENL